MKIPEKINANYYDEDKLSRSIIGERGIADKVDEIIDYLHFLKKKENKVN